MRHCAQRVDGPGRLGPLFFLGPDAFGDALAANRHRRRDVVPREQLHVPGVEQIDRIPAVARSFGRPTGVAGVGLLQVRAFALIPCGEGLRPPCASLAQGLRPFPGLPPIRPASRQVRALAARRFRCAFEDAAGGCRLPESFTLSVTLRARRRGTGCACKGVFITHARYEGFPLAPPSPRAPAVTGRRTQEDGGRRLMRGRCDPEPFHEGLRI